MGPSNTDPTGDAPVAHGLLGSVLHDLLEGLQVVDSEYRYVYLNATAARQGRSTPEALVGKTMMEAYPGIDATQMFGVLRRTMEGGAPTRMESSFTFADGSVGWFELHFEPVSAGVAILSADITDRKRAEMALARSMRALTTLSRSNQTLVRAVEEDSLVRDVARIVVEAGGYPMAWIGRVETEGDRRVRRMASADARGVPSEETLARLADSRGMASLVDRALTRGRAEVVHFASAEVDKGLGLWQEAALAQGFSSCIALPLSGQAGQVGVLVIYAAEAEAFDDEEMAVLREVALDLGYGLDVLAMRAGEAGAREELEELRGRARAIFDHLPHATIVWRGGERRLTLVDMNEAALKLLEGRAPARRGMQASALASVIPELEADLAKSLRGGGPIRREVELDLEGLAEPLRMALSYGSIPPDMVLLHMQDVTRERRTEAQLLAGERLEAVGRLAGGVAHDFNNLLSVILTSAEFALTRLGPADPIREDLEQVQAAGQRAAALTKQLLAFGRRQVLEPQVTDLNRVLDALGEMLRRLVGADIALEFSPAEGLGSVLADAGQLERVVINLALNARDAMPLGGKLTIETANTDLEVAPTGHGVAVRPGRYVCLSVTDTGAGMSAEVRDRVFEPFFTTKSGGRGTGLGLSSVYGIVKQSDGYIWVFSELGQGTSFKIYLPRVDAPVVERHANDRAAPSSGGETILIVEDEAGVRRASERILRAGGFRVLSAASGPEALALCDEHQEVVHLLLSDVVMPGMSGPEVAAKLKAARPGLKVLFMSGYADQALSQHGVRSETTHFIAKPFSVDGLRRKVREVLDGG